VCSPQETLLHQAFTIEQHLRFFQAAYGVGSLNRSFELLEQLNFSYGAGKSTLLRILARGTPHAGPDSSGSSCTQPGYAAPARSPSRLPHHSIRAGGTSSLHEGHHSVLTHATIDNIPNDTEWPR
jgi:hypothetical protein